MASQNGDALEKRKEVIMKRSMFSLIAAMLCVMLLFAGCASGGESSSQSSADSTAAEPDSSEDSAEPESSGDSAVRTITDHAGNEVILPEKVERVAIGGLTPLTSVYCMFMGSSDGLVGIHPDSKNAAVNSILGEAYPGLKELPDGWASGDDINMEELLKLKPDVVFYNADVTANYEALEAVGIPAVGFSTTLYEDYNTIDTFQAWIELLKDVMGDSDRADGIIAYGEEVKSMVAEKLASLSDEEKPQALILSNYNESAITAGGISFANYWIASAGGNNLGYDIGAFVGQVNMEQVYEWNPEVLFLNSFSAYTPEDLYENTAVDGHDWSGIKAVQNKRVYKIPLGMYYWFPPSSDSPLMLQWMAKQMHPDLFEDLDIEQEVREYYAQFYGIELTDEQLDLILNPTPESAAAF